MRLVILDRDGVINQDSEAYIKSPDEWIPLPGSLEAIAELNRAGFRVVVATNQSGVGRGLFDLDMLQRINDKMTEMLAAKGGHLDGIFFCPHHPDAHCDCRKPKPGLLRQISRHFGVNLAQVPVIGDSARDVEAAESVGARPILVNQPAGESNGKVEVFPDLAAAAQQLIRESRP